MRAVVPWLLLPCVLSACDLVRSGGPPTPGTLPPITAEALTVLPPAEGHLTLLRVVGPPLPIARLQAATGCAIEVFTERTSYDLWSAAHTEPVDVLLATTDVSRRLMRDDILQPLDPALIPSFGAVDHVFRAAPWNTFEGQTFGVPQQWGPEVLVFDPALFPEPPTSWRVLYNEVPLADGGTNLGRVQAQEAPIALAQTALLLMHAEPALGIVDPYALSEAQFRATLRATRAQRKLVDRYWQEPDRQIADLVAGRVAVTSAQLYTVRAAQQAGASLAWTLPEEGALAWAVTALVPRDAVHPGCALRFLEASLDPSIQAEIVQTWASVPARAEACAQLAAGTCAAHGAERRDDLHFWRTPELACDAHPECVPLHAWQSQHTLARGGL